MSAAFSAIDFEPLWLTCLAAAGILLLATFIYESQRAAYVLRRKKRAFRSGMVYATARLYKGQNSRTPTTTDDLRAEVTDRSKPDIEESFADGVRAVCDIWDVANRTTTRPGGLT